MKCHPGWLATGLLIFVVLACGNNNNSNNSNSNNRSSSETRPPNAEVYVEKINMAKDKNGQPGEATTSFAPDEHTVHCVAHLNKAKAGTKIKFTWATVDVSGAPNNDEIKSFDYTTNASEDIVHAHLTFPKDWPKGTYKVQVYVDGVLSKTIDYKIE